MSSIKSNYPFSFYPVIRPTMTAKSFFVSRPEQCCQVKLVGLSDCPNTMPDNVIISYLCNWICNQLRVPHLYFSWWCFPYYRGRFTQLGRMKTIFSTAEAIKSICFLLLAPWNDNSWNSPFLFCLAIVLFIFCNLFLVLCFLLSEETTGRC